MKKQLVSTGVILALLGSNFIIGNSYKNSNKEYENKITMQSKLIEQNRVDIRLLTEAIETKTFENDDLLDRINIMNQQLGKVKKENSALKNENIKLKKDLAIRKEAKKHRKLNMRLSFYGSDCYKCSGITATGINVKNTIYYKNMRIVAADPRVIKLHSIIKIETKTDSYLAYVADTGGKIIGNKLDVLVSSERESFQHGVQQATVTIIKEGRNGN